MHDALDVRLAVSASGQQLGDFHQVCNGIEIGGRLLTAEGAIQVRAYARVPRVARAS